MVIVTSETVRVSMTGEVTDFTTVYGRFCASYDVIKKNCDMT